MSKANKTEGNTIPVLIVLVGALFSGLGLAQAVTPAAPAPITHVPLVHESSFDSNAKGGALSK